MGEGSAADTAVELTDVQAKDIERGDPNPISPVSPSSTFAPPQRLPRRETHDSVCHGYPRLAHWVGREPSFAIFRRFATLNAKNILYLQAEIAYLELELDELERLNSDDCGSLQTHLQGLLNAPEGSSGHKQMQKMLEIRGKLKEYSWCPWESPTRRGPLADGSCQTTCCWSIPSSIDSLSRIHLTSRSCEHISTITHRTGVPG